MMHKRVTKCRQAAMRSVLLFIVLYQSRSVRVSRMREHVPTKRRVASCRPSDQSACVMQRDVTRGGATHLSRLSDVSGQEVSWLHRAVAAASPGHKHVINLFGKAQLFACAAFFAHIYA